MTPGVVKLAQVDVVRAWLGAVPGQGMGIGRRGRMILVGEAPGRSPLLIT